MNIIINNIAIEALAGETLIETAGRAGYVIPSLCYAKGAVHKSSCMVCAVKNEANGQIIPSCSTYPTEGMHIATDSDDVLLVRSLSLELLLSDHRADCEAPCSMVCPKGLDIEKMLGHYDAGRYPEAAAMLVDCEGCKAPCEKACRRGTVDRAVAIREIIREIAAMHGAPTPAMPDGKAGKAATDKKLYISRLGRFSDGEKSLLKQTVKVASRCLHCACAGRNGCKLRTHATDAKIKRPRYDASSALPVMDRTHVVGRLWFEVAKCIRCGLCVYNTGNGFTFKDRGFGMQVVIPEENKGNVDETLAGLCPTGALYLIDS